MSVKIERINNLLQIEISYVLATEVKDRHIKFVTVTAVETTKDLSQAKVYVTVLNDDFKEETLRSLKTASGYIRRQLFERVDLRNIPELIFIYDESIAYGQKIEDLIEDLNKGE